MLIKMWMTDVNARTVHGLLLIPIVVLAMMLPVSAATEKSYEPSLGTLPDAQGWTLYETAPASPVPTVSGGNLKQGLTTVGGVQYWYNTGVQNDFGNHFQLELKLKVISSGDVSLVGPPASWRAGYTVFAADKNSRLFILGITSTGIRLTNVATCANANSTSYSFDTTNALHTYKLLVTSAGGGQVFIDNVLRASLATGATGQYAANKVVFGDTNGSAGSQTDLAFLRYSVPEPSSILALGVGIASLLGRRRRK